MNIDELTFHKDNTMLNKLSKSEYKAGLYEFNGLIFKKTIDKEFDGTSLYSETHTVEFIGQLTK